MIPSIDVIWWDVEESEKHLVRFKSNIGVFQNNKCRHTLNWVWQCMRGDGYFPQKTSGCYRKKIAGTGVRGLNIITKGFLT